MPLKTGSGRDTRASFAPFGGHCYLSWPGYTAHILIFTYSKLLGVQITSNGSEKYRKKYGAGVGEREGLIKNIAF